MSRRNPFINMIVGPGVIESRVDYKYAVLRGQLGFLMGFICVVFIPIDVINGVYTFIPWYLSGTAIAILIIVFNRLGYFWTSTLILLVTSNLFVYFFAAVDNPLSGVFFFFTAAALMGIIFFYNMNWIYALLFASSSLILALMAFFADWSPIPPPVQTAKHIEVNFVTNLIMGMSASVLVLLFVMKRNKESEKALLNQQDKLKDLALELEKSKNRFASAIEGSSAGIYEWHIPDNDIYVSPKYKKLLGYDEGDPDFTFGFYMSLIHPEDLERANDAIQIAFSSSKPYQNELRLKKKNGEYNWFLDSGIIKFQGGKPLMAAGSIKDISDRKKAESELMTKNIELEKINTELDRFVYSASHDMRAPLSTLLGLIQLAELTDDKTEMKSYFKMMTDRIQTMEGFIKEVTDFSRNARLELDILEVNLNELILEIIDSFDFLSKEARVTIELDIDTEYIVYSDETRLRVIFNNLLSNAIKYHDKEKEERWVKLGVSCQSDHCEIEVRDNGVGIEPVHKEKIFDMFFRASEISDGSGLGLYIVHETLQKLGGSIDYTSSTDSGTVFTVQLPYNLKNREVLEAITEN